MVSIIVKEIDIKAHNLCQIGNIGLVLDVMGKWIKEKS
jgi:hypothetical protein